MQNVDYLCALVRYVLAGLCRAGCKFWVLKCCSKVAGRGAHFVSFFIGLSALEIRQVEGRLSVLCPLRYVVAGLCRAGCKISVQSGCTVRGFVGQWNDYKCC